MLMASTAFGGVKTNIFGMGSWGGLTKVTVGGSEVKGDFGYGGGLSFEFGSPKVGLEIGAMFQSLPITTTTGALSSTTRNKQLFAPAGLRFHMSPAVSLMVGGFYDYSLENSVTDKGAYGVTGGLKVYMGRVFFIEPRFNYYMKALPDIGKAKDIMALIGWTFGKGR
jgi:hypothetical protein